MRQIVLQCVLFFRGLSCAESCSNVRGLFRFIVRQIVLYGLKFLKIRARKMKKMR